MHELLADVVEELLGRAAAAAEGGAHASVAADAWTLVTDIVTEPYRDNALGVYWYCRLKWTAMQKPACSIACI